jgi:transposase
MFTLPSSVAVFICCLPTDMRKSFDSLAAAVEQIICQNPLSGHLFVFFNRPRSMVKILFWDRSGYCLYYKRLESGTFALPEDVMASGDSAPFSLPDLMLILEGIDLSMAHRRKRFSLKKVA